MNPPYPTTRLWPPSPVVVHTESIPDKIRSVWCYLRIWWTQTFWHRLPIFQVDLYTARFTVWYGNLVVPRTRRRIGDRTFSIAAPRAWNRLWSNGAETAAIDGLVSLWSENISVSFCLRAPGYGLTLWCALGLLVGGAIQVPQLAYCYCYITGQNANVVSHR